MALSGAMASLVAREIADLRLASPRAFGPFAQLLFARTASIEALFYYGLPGSMVALPSDPGGAGPVGCHRPLRRRGDPLGVWGDALIAQADAAVYAAKRLGRNRVQVAIALAA